MDRTVVALLVAVTLPVVVLGVVYLIARRANRITGAPVSPARMRKLARVMVALGLIELGLAAAVLVLDRELVRGLWFAAQGLWFTLWGAHQWRHYRDLASPGRHDAAHTRGRRRRLAGSASAPIASACCNRGTGPSLRRVAHRR